MFSIVFEKPGESAENVCAALKKIDELLLEHSGCKFEPRQWTSDNSGALENGILRAKGSEIKPFLGSDKLHDINNINRVVLKSVPRQKQAKVKKQIHEMINGAVPSVCEDLFKCLLDDAVCLKDQSLHRSLVFNYRKRHKYWYCYRKVVDNNATSEQVNRVMTRHGKGEGLVDAVQRMVRSAINDKGKFNLAANGQMVNRGPTVKDRKIRVERALVKSLPEIVTSIRMENKSQHTPVEDDLLKQKALNDFKAKTSDTHRSDKKRRATKSQKKNVKTFKKKELAMAKRSRTQKGLSLVSGDSDKNEVIVTFSTNIGIEETVTIVQDSVMCTCDEHDKNYYCSEIVELFHLLKLESLVRKLKFSDIEFALIVKKAKALLKKINTV